MTQFLVGLIVGLVVGTVIGALTMSALIASSRRPPT